MFGLYFKVQTLIRHTHFYCISCISFVHVSIVAIFILLCACLVEIVSSIVLKKMLHGFFVGFFFLVEELMVFISFVHPPYD